MNESLVIVQPPCLTPRAVAMSASVAIDATRETDEH